ncbi:hypothetical protein ACKWTF_006656 [Chironomus riparius]
MSINLNHASANECDETERLISKPKYPFSVFFIISNEFCERFNYYGMRTILSIYLTQKLLYSDDTATMLYHSFVALVYFCCIVGAIIADSWLGKFNTIVCLSFVCITGCSILTLGTVESWHLPTKTLTFIGLILVAFGSGGIKPCIATFGGEQFQLPDQAKQLSQFFSIFFFSVNSGAFLSTLVTPILREDVKCMGMDTCFPFGFGLPAILMAVSIIIFLSGKFLYKIFPVQGNMFLRILKCIINAISTKRKEKITNPRNHWLEYAEPKFGKKLVMETKILLNVLVLYLPLPIFWALFDQIGSRWTFQATRMDGDIGFYTIKPDQIQVINPILFLTFIPLSGILLNPILAFFGIGRPLQKLTIGGIIAGIAFLCSMYVEIMIEPAYPILPKVGFSQFRMYNARNCEYNVATTLNGNASNFNIESNGYFQDNWVPINGSFQDFPYNLTSQNQHCQSYQGTGNLNSGTANSLLITGNGSKAKIHEFEDNPDKSRNGKPVIRVLANINPVSHIKLQNQDGIQYDHNSSYMKSFEVPDGTYNISINNRTVESGIKFKRGGVYAVVVHEEADNKYAANISIITPPNSISILWLIPQYILMTIAEIFYSITGLQFSYTQAPESIRSVIRGCWLLTVSFGNILVIMIVAIKLFDSQINEFLFFACLIFVDMALFMWLAIRYKPISLDEVKNLESEGSSEVVN